MSSLPWMSSDRSLDARGYALAFGLVAFVCAGTGARAEMGASASAPIVRDIDERCDARVKKATRVPDVLLTRLYDRAGKPGPWRRSTVELNAAMTGGSEDTFYRADVAGVSRARDATIADIASVDSSGDGSSETAWCFLDGKLARAHVTIGSATDDAVWKRSDYYGDTNELLTHATRVVDTSRTHRAVPTWPPGTQSIPAYRTVSALPFYAAYRAALAGTLPPLRVPRRPRP